MPIQALATREREARAMIETNYLGAFHCTQAVLPRMLARRSGTE